MIVPTVRLRLSAGIRECAALKQQLLPHLNSVDAVHIDVTDVEIVDTAALQLLFAFHRERSTNGLSTVWRGESAALRSAAAAMGLSVGACIAPSAESVSKHDS